MIMVLSEQRLRAFGKTNGNEPFSRRLRVPVLSPYVFEYFLSGNITDVTVTSEDIPNLLARDLTRKVLYFLFLLLRDLECDQ